MSGSVPPLRVLGLAWACAGILHCLTFAYLAPPRWEGFLYLASTLLLLLRPASPSVFVAFLLTTAVALCSSFGVLANHLVFELWITVSILFVLALNTRALRKQTLSFKDLFHQTLAPLLRAQYLTLYIAAFGSKLNRDFLHPDSSCAAFFVREIIRFYHLDAIPLVGALEESTAFAYTAIGATLGLELLIPVLLFLRRTRRLGILIAVGFHLAMGLVPILGISSFSSLSFVLLLCFLPSTALEQIDERLRSLAQRFFRTSTIAILIKGSCVAGLLVCLYLQYRYIRPGPTLATAIWILLSVPTAYLLLSALRSTEPEATPPKGTLPLRWCISLCSPLVVLAALPYLGLQTQGSFTMFSNLRIHGEKPNHLIAQPSWRLFEPELVRIIGTNHPALTDKAGDPQRLTTHELRRAIGSYKNDYYILCEYRGEIILIGRFQGQLTPHPLLEPLPSFPHSLLRFKPISTNERCECVW